MTLVRIALALSVFAPAAALGCSSTEVDIEPRTIDAGEDAPPSPPPPSPPPDDAGSIDAARPDVRPASRLEVVCAKTPCYTAVSGNGGGHVCGLLSDGTVRCWGRDTPGGGTPTPVVGLTDVAQISVGPNLGTCARTRDGSVHCWGKNDVGQLGRPSVEAHLAAPTRVEGLPPASHVALGGQIGCAVARDDGALWCWGARSSRVAIAAEPGTSPEFPPQRFSGFRAPVRELAIGTAPASARMLYADTIVALLDGDVLATLGTNPVTPLHPSAPASPLPVELLGVARAGAFGYLTRDGLLFRWMPERRALYVPYPANVVDVAISGGIEPGVFGTSFVAQAGVLFSNGRLFRWGLNTAGALGHPPAELDIATEPLDMTHVAGDRVVSFATTVGATCVSNVDGAVRCWGSNQYGELGRGTADLANHPEAEDIR